MKPRHPREQVSEEPPNIPQERAFAFYAPQLLEERQRQYLRVRKLLEGFVAFAARVEAGVSVVHEAEEHDDRLFNGAQGGGTKTSKFSAMRSGRTDFGIAERPSCRCHRSITCAGVLPCASAMPRIVGSSKVRPVLPLPR
jgi:hypothetical protein